jgi:hypothetical protein
LNRFKLLRRAERKGCCGAAGSGRGQEDLAVAGGQQHPAQQGDHERAQQGCGNGEPDIDEGCALDNRHGNEKCCRQMEEIAGQAVEQVGQDQLLATELLVVVALGQHAVGGHSRKEAD